MKQIIVSAVLILLVNQCLCQTGFPKQFQTTLNITGQSASPPLSQGAQKLLYDYENLRVRFDIQGWRSEQKEAYMIKYKPEGAEADSPASQGYTMFNFNPDYPELTKNDCWYRTDPMNTVGPFPDTWIFGTQGTQIQPWVPLPSNLINKGEEWIPEVQLNATRYDSPIICDLKRSGIGKVPCFSYFETLDRPVKTIYARAAKTSFDADDYISTFYLSFTHGIPSEAEQLFDLPPQWPSYCGNANNGFSVDPVRGYVVTPDGGDHLKLQLQTPPVHSLGDEVTVEFKVKSNWYYNGTRCAKFNPIVFNRENWDKPFQVDMSFVDYGCCNYIITATGGGYDWQYTPQAFVVYACDGQAGYGCKGKEPCVSGESCNGAVVQNGTHETIIDANNDTWTIRSDSTIDKNGQLAGFSADVVRLVYWDGIIYQTNQTMGWWKWINNGWADVNDTQLILNLTSATGRSYAIISDTPPLSYFVPQICNDSSYIGDSCNISMQPCNTFKPCQDFGNCTDDPSFLRGYSCMCNSGFNGVDCESDIQVCQPNICLYNGTCNDVNNTDFYCDCTQGHTDIHCELLINYCDNVTCLNKGICRSLILNYTCECLSSTSGRHCEDVSTGLRIHQYVSKSFAYIAIIIILTTTSFIIILDILKYVFGIDVAHRECNRIQPKQRASRNKSNRKKRKPQKTIRLRRTNKITPLPKPSV